MITPRRLGVVELLDGINDFGISSFLSFRAPPRLHASYITSQTVPLHFG